ncbi:GD11002 [Drosophila simulans]|uniref:GD11002 n=1 Tax=Drosophila simulans TaxID=7240 RepID=B4QEX7_DROSI|nr:GD11002 [Drosophila simulans]
MFFKKCCFFLPLNVGCIIIGAIFITFHVGELITHSDDTIFIKQVSHKWWAPVIMSPILTIGTLSSILLVYAASKLVRSKPSPIILAVQVFIIVLLVYAWLVVWSYYIELLFAYEDELETGYV